MRQKGNENPIRLSLPVINIEQVLDMKSSRITLAPQVTIPVLNEVRQLVFHILSRENEHSSHLICEKLINLAIQLQSRGDSEEQVSFRHEILDLLGILNFRLIQTNTTPERLRGICKFISEGSITEMNDTLVIIRQTFECNDQQCKHVRLQTADAVLQAGKIRLEWLTSHFGSIKTEDFFPFLTLFTVLSFCARTFDTIRELFTPIFPILETIINKELPPENTFTQNIPLVAIKARALHSFTLVVEGGFKGKPIVPIMDSYPILFNFVPQSFQSFIEELAWAYALVISNSDESRVEKIKQQLPYFVTSKFSIPGTFYSRHTIVSRLSQVILPSLEFSRIRLFVDYNLDSLYDEDSLISTRFGRFLKGCQDILTKMKSDANTTAEYFVDIFIGFLQSIYILQREVNEILQINVTDEEKNKFLINTSQHLFETFHQVMETFNMALQAFDCYIVKTHPRDLALRQSIPISVSQADVIATIYAEAIYTMVHLRIATNNCNFKLCQTHLVGVPQKDLKLTASHLQLYKNFERMRNIISANFRLFPKMLSMHSQQFVFRVWTMFFQRFFQGNDILMDVSFVRAFYPTWKVFAPIFKALALLMIHEMRDPRYGYVAPRVGQMIIKKLNEDQKGQTAFPPDGTQETDSLAVSTYCKQILDEFVRQMGNLQNFPDWVSMVAELLIFTNNHFNKCYVTVDMVKQILQHMANYQHSARIAFQFLTSISTILPQVAESEAIINLIITMGNIEATAALYTIFELSKKCHKKFWHYPGISDLAARALQKNSDTEKKRALSILLKNPFDQAVSPKACPIGFIDFGGHTFPLDTIILAITQSITEQANSLWDTLKSILIAVFKQESIDELDKLDQLSRVSRLLHPLLVYKRPQWNKLTLSLLNELGHDPYITAALMTSEFAVVAKLENVKTFAKFFTSSEYFDAFIEIAMDLAERPGMPIGHVEELVALFIQENVAITNKNLFIKLVLHALSFLSIPNDPFVHASVYKIIELDLLNHTQKSILNKALSLVDEEMVPELVDIVTNTMNRWSRLVACELILRLDIDTIKVIVDDLMKQSKYKSASVLLRGVQSLCPNYIDQLLPEAESNIDVLFSLIIVKPELINQHLDFIIKNIAANTTFFILKHAVKYIRPQTVAAIKPKFAASWMHSMIFAPEDSINTAIDDLKTAKCPVKSVNILWSTYISESPRFEDALDTLLEYYLRINTGIIFTDYDRVARILSEAGERGTKYINSRLSRPVVGEVLSQCLYKSTETDIEQLESVEVPAEEEAQVYYLRMMLRTKKWTTQMVDIMINMIDKPAYNVDFCNAIEAALSFPSRELSRLVIAMANNMRMFYTTNAKKVAEVLDELPLSGDFTSIDAEIVYWDKCYAPYLVRANDPKLVDEACAFLESRPPIVKYRALLQMAAKKIKTFTSEDTYNMFQAAECGEQQYVICDIWCHAEQTKYFHEMLECFLSTIDVYITVFQHHTFDHIKFPKGIDVPRVINVIDNAMKKFQKISVVVISLWTMVINNLSSFEPALINLWRPFCRQVLNLRIFTKKLQLQYLTPMIEKMTILATSGPLPDNGDPFVISYFSRFLMLSFRMILEQRQTSMKNAPMMVECIIRMMKRFGGDIPIFNEYLGIINEFRSKNSQLSSMQQSQQQQPQVPQQPNSFVIAYDLVLKYFPKILKTVIKCYPRMQMDTIIDLLLSNAQSQQLSVWCYALDAISKVLGLSATQEKLKNIIAQTPSDEIIIRLFALFWMADASKNKTLLATLWRLMISKSADQYVMKFLVPVAITTVLENPYPGTIEELKAAPENIKITIVKILPTLVTHRTNTLNTLKELTSDPLWAKLIVDEKAKVRGLTLSQFIDNLLDTDTFQYMSILPTKITPEDSIILTAHYPVPPVQLSQWNLPEFIRNDQELQPLSATFAMNHAVFNKAVELAKYDVSSKEIELLGFSQNKRLDILHTVDTVDKAKHLIIDQARRIKTHPLSYFSDEFLIFYFAKLIKNGIRDKTFGKLIPTFYPPCIHQKYNEIREMITNVHHLQKKDDLHIIRSFQTRVESFMESRPRPEIKDTPETIQEFHSLVLFMRNYFNEESWKPVVEMVVKRGLKLWPSDNIFNLALYATQFEYANEIAYEWSPLFIGKQGKNVHPAFKTNISLPDVSCLKKIYENDETFEKVPDHIWFTNREGAIKERLPLVKEDLQLRIILGGRVEGSMLLFGIQSISGIVKNYVITPFEPMEQRYFALCRVANALMRNYTMARMRGQTIEILPSIPIGNGCFLAQTSAIPLIRESYEIVREIISRQQKIEHPKLGDYKKNAVEFHAYLSERYGAQTGLAIFLEKDNEKQINPFEMMINLKAANITQPRIGLRLCGIMDDLIFRPTIINSMVSAIHCYRLNLSELQYAISVIYQEDINEHTGEQFSVAETQRDEAVSRLIEIVESKASENDNSILPWL